MWPTNTPHPVTTSGLSLVASYLSTNQKIQAIKELRNIANLGLKEAKDIVDAAEQHTKADPVTVVQRMSALLRDMHGIETFDQYVDEGNVTHSIPDDTRDLLKAILKAQLETNELLKDFLMEASE